MAQRKVLVIDAGHQAFDELDATDIPGGAGSPTDADYLVGTANAGLSAEIVVGTTPGGELGGTWASPTVDASHSGSTHAGLSGQPGSTDVAVADGGTGSSTAANARTALGLVIGTDVRAQGSGDPTAASLGLSSSDSPQFTAVNVGHATDTTLARVSAGVLSVEGNALYAAGGTDVPVTDGGTGASTAAGAQTNLGLVIGTNVAAFVPASGFGTPPTGILAETYGRNSGSGNNATLVTTRLQMVAIQLPKGMTVTNIQFYSATTALSVGVNQWFALFDISRNKLAVTSDDTSTAWAANSQKSLALSTPYLVPTSGLYYLGIVVVATTVPTLMGIGALGVVAAIPPILHGDSTTALTNPASCPATAAALSNATTTKMTYATVS